MTENEQNRNSTQMNENIAFVESEQSSELVTENPTLDGAEIKTTTSIARVTSSNGTRKDPKEYIDAPFWRNYKENETVILNSGAFNYTTTDLTLPGRNGLDLTFRRRYDSSTANAKDATLYYDQVEKYRYGAEAYEVQYSKGSHPTPIRGTEVLKETLMFYEKKSVLYDYLKKNYPKSEDDWDDNYVGNYWPEKDDFYEDNLFLSTSTRSNDHFYKTYGLGYGWSFDFPSIESVLEQNNKIKYGVFAHLGDGRTLRIVENPTSAINSNFEGYSQIDVRIQKIGSSFVIYFKDGKEAYFDSTNKLTYIKDRYNNQISFAYDNNGRMNRITDTFGRVILLESDGSTLNLKRQDTGEIEYTYVLNDIVANNDSIRELCSVKDKMGRKTIYEYECNYTSTRICHVNSGDTSVSIPFANLKCITYPTGLKSYYTYEILDGRFSSPELGFFQKFILASRRDIINSANTSAIYNEEQYIYTATTKKPETGGENDSGETYINCTSVLSHKDWTTGAFEVKTVHTFNEDSLRTNEKVYHIISNNEKLISDRDFTYSKKLIVSEVAKTYNYSGSSVTKTSNWVYSTDNKADIVKFTEIYSGDSAINQEINIKYDDNFSIPIETIKQVNNDKHIIERNSLLADTNGKEKVIEWKRVYEKIGSAEVLKEKTKYEYDSRFRMVKQCRYYGDNLETTEKCYTTIYTYDDTKLTDNPTVTETLGVTNAEGNPAESPIEGGTIQETVNYDWYGRPVEKTDANQYTTQITYDALGRTIRETYSDGTSKTTVYDDKLNQITIIDENGDSKRYKYTPLGKIANVGVFSADTPETDLTGFEYDKIERLSRETIFAEDGTARLVINYTYDIYDNILTKKASGSGVSAEETYSYDPVYQNKFSRVLKTVDGEANAPAIVTETLTDQAGRVRQETVKGSSSLADAVVSYTYDKLGNKLSQTDALGHVTKWEYDYAGRMVKETNAAGKASLTVYDALGNKTETTDPAGNTAHFIYDALGRLLRQESPFDGDAKAVVLYEYDAVGNVLRQRTLCSTPGEPEQWRKTAYLYDSRNRLTDTLLFEEDGSENRTHYEYDNIGNKLAVYTGVLGDSLDGAQKTSYTYDRFGNVLTMTDPRSNALSPDDALYRVERYNYDKIGRLVSKTDRNGSTTTYTYDALDRVLKESITVENPSDSLTSEKYYTYTKTGQKRSEVNETLTVEYQYDAMGRLIKQSESDGTVKEFIYDANGNRTGFTLTRNGTQEISLTYVYDSLNRLSEVQKAGTVLAKYGYDANGNRSSLDYPESGILTTYSYNAANLVVSLENKKDGNVLSSFRYTYYLDGNQKDKTEQNGTVTNYLYDSMGRLRQESESGRKTIVYTYDRFSNRAKMTVSGTESYETSYTYHPNNWLLIEEKRQGDTVETTRYRYDANGNQVYREWEKVSPEDTETGTMKFVSDTFQEDIATLETREYNGFNELVAVCRDGMRIAYRYRPDGLRYGKTIRERDGATGSTIHLWDGQNIVAEIGATGKVTARYLRGINLIVREQDGANQYYLFNAHGDVTQRADAWGNVLKNYRYDAFGNEQSPEKLDSNPFRYCGEYFDQETGEIYLRARYYNPAIGRFGAEDSVRSATYALPNKQQIDDPLSLNLYIYCHNDPVTFTDPTGHSMEQVLNGSMSMYLGYAAMTAGLAVLTVATGGLALAVAAGTVVAGGGLVVYGAYEASEGITGYNSLKSAQGEQVYYNTMGLLSVGAPMGAAYSAQYYQMYAPISQTINANVDVGKFSEYALTPEQSKGKNAVFYGLGYGPNDAKKLANIYQRQASARYTAGEYTLGKLDQYGQRVNIEIILPGVGKYSGKVSYINSGWMIQKNGEIKLNTPFSGFTR